MPILIRPSNCRTKTTPPRWLWPGNSPKKFFPELTRMIRARGLIRVTTKHRRFRDRTRYQPTRPCAHELDPYSWQRGMDADRLQPHKNLPRGESERPVVSRDGATHQDNRSHSTTRDASEQSIEW